MTAELEDIILYLVYHAPKSLTKTSLIKLSYLVDYRHWQLYGEQLTDCVWECDQLGPVDYYILDVARGLNAAGKLIMQEGPTGYGDPMTQYLPKPGFDPVIKLGSRAQTLLAEILDRFGKKSARKLVNICHLTEPFLVGPRIRDRLDMDQIKRTVRLKDYPEIQRLRRRLASMDLSERGDPEEWAQHITEVYQSTAGARKRATTTGLEGHVDS